LSARSKNDFQGLARRLDSAPHSRTTQAVERRNLSSIRNLLTQRRHPWTNGQVERMNHTIKDATVKRFHYDTHDELRSHLVDFVSAYNFAKAAQDPQTSHAL
jgi:Integrase core domain